MTFNLVTAQLLVDAYSFLILDNSLLIDGHKPDCLLILPEDAGEIKAEYRSNKKQRWKRIAFMTDVRKAKDFN